VFKKSFYFIDCKGISFLFTLSLVGSYSDLYVMPPKKDFKTLSIIREKILEEIDPRQISFKKSFLQERLEKILSIFEAISFETLDYTQKAFLQQWLETTFNIFEEIEFEKMKHFQAAEVAVIRQNSKRLSERLKEERRAAEEERLRNQTFFAYVKETVGGAFIAFLRDIRTSADHVNSARYKLNHIRSCIVAATWDLSGWPPREIDIFKKEIDELLEEINTAARDFDYNDKRRQYPDINTMVKKRFENRILLLEERVKLFMSANFPGSVVNRWDLSR